jgi:hypothetical protein
MNQANLGMDTVVFRQNGVDTNLRNDIFLHRVLEKGWRRQVNGKEKEWGRCGPYFCKMKA